MTTEPCASNMEFVLPTKRVKSMMEVVNWKQSQSYAHYISFIRHLCTSVHGGVTKSHPKVAGRRGDAKHVTVIGTLVDILVECQTQVDKIPMQDMDAQRFGNKSYRTWFDWMVENSTAHIDRLLAAAPPSVPRECRIELAAYWRDSFGNQTRIDYGTGHELTFVMFLCCLHRVRAVEVDDLAAVVCLVFDGYMHLCRHLQTTYRMEPAGSKGVYCLDDFQFIVYILGSGQLCRVANHHLCTPDSFIDEALTLQNADDYLFYAAVQYINETKTGPFCEHSNQLWNISCVQSWTKVNGGLIKMYENEVINKYPTVQHFLFGNILSIDPVVRN